MGLYIPCALSSVLGARFLEGARRQSCGDAIAPQAHRTISFRSMAFGMAAGRLITSFVDSPRIRKGNPLNSRITRSEGKGIGRVPSKCGWERGFSSRLKFDLIESSSPISEGVSAAAFSPGCTGRRARFEESVDNILEVDGLDISVSDSDERCGRVIPGELAMMPRYDEGIEAGAAIPYPFNLLFSTTESGWPLPVVEMLAIATVSATSVAGDQHHMNRRTGVNGIRSSSKNTDTVAFARSPPW